MADWLNGEMTIGGPLPESGEVLDRLVTLMAENDEECKGNLLVAFAEGSFLIVRHSQARSGEFPDLETFCQKHGIAFSRSSDGTGEYSNERVHFRPGYPRFRESCLSDGSPAVETLDLWEVIDKPWEKVEDLIAALQKLLGPKLPDLTPLTEHDIEQVDAHLTKWRAGHGRVPA
jgi:hypothetical protein